MINEKLITYLHSVYPELPIDTNYKIQVTPEQYGELINI